MAVNAEVQAAISRYLVEVATYLGGRSPDQRRELLADLESHIHEALAARGHEATPADLEAVLAEMAPPESYATASAAPPAAPAAPAAAARGSRAAMAWLALGLCIGGIVLYLVIATICAAVNARADAYGDAAVLWVIIEIMAFVLGILSWREKVGKVATIGVIVQVVIFGGLLFLMLLYRNMAIKEDIREAASARDVRARSEAAVGDLDSADAKTARQAVVDRIKKGELKPNADGAVLLAGEPGGVSCDGNAYVKVTGGTNYLVIFPTWRGKAANMQGYLYADALPDIPNAAGLARVPVLLPCYGTPSGTVEADVDIIEEVSPHWYRVEQTAD